ncbi:MAG: hypothetical protein IJX11_03455 [Bacteroidales bacterium]|nr:hypothetical protein [Bacteroidales bacterium]
MRRTVLTYALFLISLCCSGFHPNVRNFDRSTYKAGTQNWCITQGAGGCIVAANTGILEFDGLEWWQTHTLNRTSVRSLYYDRENDRMYYGGTNELGYVRMGGNQQMEMVTLLDTMDVFLGEIWGIHKIGEDLWLRENGRMHRFDFRSMTQHDFPGLVSYSTEIGGRLIVFVNGSGAYELDGNGKFSIISQSEALAGMKVCAILPYGAEGLLFVTSTYGLFLLKDGRLSPLELDFSPQLRHSNVFCAATDGRHLAFGTVADGVFIRNLSDGRSMHLNTFSGLQNNTVLSMFYDRKGDLWLGLDKGIDLVQLSNPEYRLFGNDDIFGSGYASAIYDGALWLGTNQGLYRTPYPLSGRMLEDSDILPVEGITGQVWSLLSYDGRLFCCHDRGLYIIRNGKLTHIPLNGAWKLEPLAEWQDRLLGSTYDRLFLLRKSGGEWRFDGFVEGFEDSTKAFEEDMDRRIWFGHWVKGLFRLTLDVEKRMVTGSEYFSRNEGFPQDWSNTPSEVNGEVIFTTTEGFYRYDSYTGKVHPQEQLNKLFNRSPSGVRVFTTPQGESYFSSGTMQGLYFKGEDGAYRFDTLSLRQVAPKRIVGFDDIISLSDKSLMVNTEDGFSIIMTDMIRSCPVPDLAGNVFVKEIHTTQSRGDSLIFSSRSDSLCRNAAIRLPYSCNSLKFKAAHPRFESDDAVQFSFLLENYDSDWSQYSPANSKEYTKLPHGRYVFRTRARCSTDGTISECTVPVTIDAPWYRSKAAMIIYAVLLWLPLLVIFKTIQHLSIKRAGQISRRQEEEMLQKQMKADLEHKAQDLAASTMNVIRKNEILLDIDADIAKATEYIAEDRNRSLKILGKIRHDIRENIQHDDVWHKFEKNFDIVYDDYLSRLGKSYPQLTVSDKKMCAYLKMGLSSKEIAPLLNMTVRSVEMTRYRLRKKLELPHDENLMTFLQRF